MLFCLVFIDIVFIDIDMFEMSGIEVLFGFWKWFLEVKLVMFI